MKVSLKPNDQPILRWGLKKMAQMADLITKQSSHIKIDATPATTAGAQYEKVKETLDRASELGFDGEVEIPADQCTILDTAAGVWMAKAQKAEEDQQELTIDTAASKARQLEGEDLQKRLRGELGLGV